MTQYTITREDAYGFKTVRHADTAQDAAMIHATLESLPGTLAVTTHDPEVRITAGTVVGDRPERPDTKVPSALDQQLASAMDGVVYVKPPSALDGVVHVKPPSALDVQEGGDHYKNMKIQPVEFIHANGIPFIEGCVIKYVARWRAKGGKKDLEKARHFIDLLIELESKKE